MQETGSNVPASSFGWRSRSPHANSVVHVSTTTQTRGANRVCDDRAGCATCGCKVAPLRATSGSHELQLNQYRQHHKHQNARSHFLDGQTAKTFMTYLAKRSALGLRFSHLAACHAGGPGPGSEFLERLAGPRCASSG